jgi:transcription elongation factor GreA
MREIMIKLETELRQLERELRIDLPKEIKAALAQGDLRENAEYHAALERQAFVQARIGQLRQRLSDLGTMNLTQIPKDRAALGSRLTLLDLDTDEEVVYELVVPELADSEKGLISVNSPVGRGLVGKRPDDQVSITIPVGSKRYEVLELETTHDRD